MNHFLLWNVFCIILDWVEVLGSNFALKIHFLFKDPKTPPTCQVSEITPDPYKWEWDTILVEGGNLVPSHPSEVCTWQVFIGESRSISIWKECLSSRVAKPPPLRVTAWEGTHFEMDQVLMEPVSCVRIVKGYRTCHASKSCLISLTNQVWLRLIFHLINQFSIF